MKGRSEFAGYALAAISCGVALAVAWPIDAPASCFLLAVTVSGLFGGLGPGVLSIGVSAVAFNYFFLHRTLPFGRRAGYIFAIGSFPGCGIADYGVDGD